MPTDISMGWNIEEQSCQMSFVDNDIVTTKSLLPAVLVSLFCDARAEADDPLPNPDDPNRRGWWADATNTAKPGDSVGSKLWLLERSKTTPDTVNKAKNYAETALQWMVDEGVCKSVLATAESQALATPGSYMLALHVELTKPDGTTENYKFEREWRATVDGV